MTSTWTTIDRTHNTQMWVDGISSLTKPLYAVFFAMDAPWPGEGQGDPPPSPPSDATVADISEVAFYYRIDRLGVNASIRYVAPTDTNHHFTYGEDLQGYVYVPDDEIYTVGCTTALLELRIPAGSISYDGNIRGWGLVKDIRELDNSLAVNESYLVSEIDTTSGNLFFVENIPTSQKETSKASEFKLLRLF